VLICNHVLCFGASRVQGKLDPCTSYSSHPVHPSSYSVIFIFTSLMRQERKGSVILPSLVKPCLLPLNVLRSWWDVWNSGRISRPWETALEKEAIMQMLHLPHKDDRYALKCFPAGTSGKEPTCQCRRHKRQVRSLGWEDPLEEDVGIHSSICARESHGQRSLAGNCP